MPQRLQGLSCISFQGILCMLVLQKDFGEEGLSLGTGELHSYNKQGQNHLRALGTLFSIRQLQRKTIKVVQVSPWPGSYKTPQEPWWGSGVFRKLIYFYYLPTTDNKTLLEIQTAWIQWTTTGASVLFLTRSGKLPYLRWYSAPLEVVLAGVKCIR